MPIDTIQLGQILSDPEFMLPQLNRLAHASTVQHFDDFTGDDLSNYILHSGSDDLAVDPAFNAQVGGVVRLSAGDGDGAIAVDQSIIVLPTPFKAEDGNLAFEVRLKFTDITKNSLYVGFTDITTADEEGMHVSGTTLTTDMADGFGFVFDTAMTTDEFWAAGVDTNTDATGSGTTGIAPVNGTYNVLRMEVDTDGQGARAYIDGTLVKTLTAKVTTPTVAQYFVVSINGDASNSAVATVDVDYILVESDRPSA